MPGFLYWFASPPPVATTVVVYLPPVMLAVPSVRVVAVSVFTDEMAPFVMVAVPSVSATASSVPSLSSVIMSFVALFFTSM